MDGKRCLPVQDDPRQKKEAGQSLPGNGQQAGKRPTGKELRERLARSDDLLRRTTAALRAAGEINDLLQEQVEIAKGYIGCLLAAPVAGADRAEITLADFNAFRRAKAVVLTKRADGQAVIIRVVPRED